MKRLNVLPVIKVHIRSIRLPNPPLPPRLVPDPLIPRFEKLFSRTEAIFWYTAQLDGCRIGYQKDNQDFKELYRLSKAAGMLELPDTAYMRLLARYIIDWFPTGFQEGEGWLLSQATFLTVLGSSHTRSIPGA